MRFVGHYGGIMFPVDLDFTRTLLRLPASWTWEHLEISFPTNYNLRLAIAEFTPFGNLRIWGLHDAQSFVYEQTSFPVTRDTPTDYTINTWTTLPEPAATGEATFTI